MGSRGPKPVAIGLLSSWEFEFYKALHLLRDGFQLPPKREVFIGLTPSEARTMASVLRKMSAPHYWLTSRRVGSELGSPTNLKRPPSRMDLEWAEQQKDDEIRWLERELKPPTPKAVAKRQEIWKGLVDAESYSGLRKICGRWAQLPDVRVAGMSCFPEHIVKNAAQFLSMKRNKRFPGSSYADDSRLEYLARGMAGVMCGLSPMTAIERLRNMEHDQSGPMWIVRQGEYVLPENHRYCGCWQCSIRKSESVTHVTQRWYENGLKLFIDLAATTKVPSEWNLANRNRA